MAYSGNKKPTLIFDQRPQKKGTLIFDQKDTVKPQRFNQRATLASAASKALSAKIV